MTSVLLLVLSFALLLGGAVLFTNAVEWLGRELRLGQGAVGSILAAVGTALPESLIPVVAVIGGAHGSGDVAVGAIVGAPFLLATIALALVGVAVHVFRRRRDRGTELGVDLVTFRRDLVVFAALFGLRSRLASAHHASCGFSALSCSSAGTSRMSRAPFAGPAQPLQSTSSSRCTPTGRGTIRRRASRWRASSSCRSP